MEKKVKNHESNIMMKVHEHLKNNKLCDVILIAGKIRIPAHRIILSAASEYFQAMFTGSTIEATQKEIVLHKIDPYALQELINYMYTGKLELKEENIETLMTTANMLRLEEVVDDGSTFLIKQLHPSNCLGIRTFADLQNCHLLLKMANNFVFDNFTEVVENREFLQLPLDQVISLISDDFINVKSETSVALAIISWIKHKENERLSSLPVLFVHIRLPYLPKEFLFNVLQEHNYIKNSLFCQQQIIKSLSQQLLNDHLPKSIGPRTSTEGMLYAVGGMDSSKGANSVECFDPRLNTWRFVTNMSIRRQQFGVAILEGKIYIVGGRDGLKTLNSVECFEPKTQTWCFMPPVTTHRHGLGIGVLNGAMYAVGGHDGWSFLNTVERWDPQSRTWSYVAPMSVSRSTVGVAVIGNKLYAVGGRDGSSCLRSVECFDPNFNKWIPCASMMKRRGCVGVGVCSSGLLYAIGGHDAPASNQISKLTDTVERYNPSTNQWTTITPLKCPRDAVGVCTLGNSLYACGGYDGHSYLSNCEAFDPHTNQWTEVAPFNICRGGTVVVRVDVEIS